MQIKQVKALSPFKRLIYWIKERHVIHLAKEQGIGSPWTDDEILRTYFFTCPYRENDKTTVFFREYIRDPLYGDHRVFMATVIFRWFNLIDTGILLWGGNPKLPIEDVAPFSPESKGNRLTYWRERHAISRLEAYRDKGNKIFTGAYMIKAGNGPPGCKVRNVCRAITAVYKDRHKLVELCKTNSLQTVWQALTQYKYLGGFMAYEVVCDLRYTHLLDDAADVDTWCNIGPGATRGLNRLLGNKDLEKKVPNWQPEMLHLLVKINTALPKVMPRFEMREVEHSLCEFDKYERALFNQGKMKRKYNGRA